MQKQVVIWMGNLVGGWLSSWLDGLVGRYACFGRQTNKAKN